MILNRIYPERVRVHTGSAHHKAGGDTVEKRRRPTIENTTSPISLMTRFTVVLNKVEHLPAVMTLTQFLQPPVKSTPASTTTRSIASSDEKTDVVEGATLPTLSGTTPVVSDGTPRVAIDALRLIELSDRTSAVMKSSVAEELMHRDTLISVLRTFGHLNRIPVTSALSIVPRDSFSSNVASHARETDADLVVIPWSAAPSAIDENVQSDSGVAPHNPFDAIFGGRSAAVDKATSVLHSQFIRRVFVESPTDVALFIDRGLSPLETNATYGQHVFLPFFGGPDDRLALTFVVQLCVHPAVSATIVRMKKTDGLEEVDTRLTDAKAQQLAATMAANNMTVHSVWLSCSFEGRYINIVFYRWAPTLYIPRTLLRHASSLRLLTTWLGVKSLPLPVLNPRQSKVLCLVSHLLRTRLQHPWPRS